MKFISLKTKFLIGYTVLTLLLSVAIIMLVQIVVKQKFEAELRERAISIAKHAVWEVGDMIILEDAVSLQATIDGIKITEKDVEYVFITDHKHKILAHTFGKNFPTDLIGVNRVLPEDAYKIQLLVTGDEQGIYDIAMPILKGQVGFFRIGFSMDVISKTISRIIFLIIMVTFSIMLIGIFGFAIFSRTITRPLVDLSMTAEKIGQGDLNKKVIIETKDEIGKLAHAFNMMVENLKDITVSKSILDQRVVEEVEKSRMKDHMLIQQSRFAAMGEMVSAIADQWRQPISIVGLIIQDIKETYDSGELNKEYIDSSIKTGMDIIYKMSHTIDDFRSFFKPDGEKQQFNLDVIVLRALSFIDSGFENDGIKVELDLKEDITVFGYRNDYTQALLNILNNAKEALIDSKTGSPYIGIKAFRENGKAVVTVKDNGGGIQKDIIDRIFDPYFTTKNHKKGAGVGLYMSKMIIEKNMDGELTVNNTDGGAEFRVEV
ncbi:MAG: HAMP domain-containing protein [Nitrospiraceae bacterium]|nr:MAG: HAMP domain-containing protein [Nitrospiraceae bacterium]